MYNICKVCLTFFLVITLHPVAAAQPRETGQFHVSSYLGRGTSEVVTWNPVEMIFAVGGSRGIWLYTNNLEDVASSQAYLNSVSSIMWNPDGTQIAGVGSEGLLYIWSGVVEEQPIILEGHIGSLYSVAWSPDGDIVAIGGQNGNIELWNVLTRELSGTLEYGSGRILDLAWRPDGQLLVAACSDGTVYIWDPTTYLLVESLKTEYASAVHSVAWSPDGEKLASARTRVIDIWDMRTYATLVTLRGHTDGAVNALAWSPQGTQLASAGLDRTIRIWDINLDPKGSSPRILRGHTESVLSIDWNKQDRHLITVSADNTVRIWDTASGQTVAILQKHNGPVQSIAWSPDGTKIAGGDIADGKVRIWDVTTGHILAILEGHAGGVDSLSWSLGNQLVTADSQYLRIWDMSTYTLQSSVESRDITLAWSTDGTVFASADGLGTNGEIRLWNSYGQSLLVLNAHSNAVNSLSWSPDGEYLASGSRDTSIKIFNTQSNEQIINLEHEAPVLTICWNQDSSQLISGGWFEYAVIWNFPSGSKSRTIQNIGPYIVCNPRQNILANRAGKDVWIWDTQSGIRLESLVGHTNVINTFSWSPDGERLVSAGEDSAIIIWEHE